MQAHLILVTGPVRSGKSRFAEQLATETGLGVSYLATAAVDPSDLEWCARLEHHRLARPREWQVVETAHGREGELCDVLSKVAPGRVALIDSLGTWLADRMTGAHRGLIEDAAALEGALSADSASLLRALLACPAKLVVVIGEQTGWDVVPEHRSARIFRDVLGRLHQDIAAQAERVYLVVSGIALDLRAAGVPVAGRS